MRRGRIVAGLVIAGGLLFGALGGEYSTIDWWKLRGSIEREQNALNRLYVEIDSLEQVADQLETDPARQEREARERFGMIRDGEMLYRVEAVEPR